MPESVDDHERQPMDADSLRSLRGALQERETRITDEVLQVPDYPPLPPCPRCGAASENIGHQWDADWTADTVWFDPCGHRFRISDDVKMELRP